MVAAATDKVLAALTEAAIRGRRCPTTDQLGDLAGSRPRAAAALKRLTATGIIVIKISGHNWRVVDIKKGPHAGKSTMSDPNGWATYRRLDAAGDHWLTRTRCAGSGRITEALAITDAGGAALRGVAG